MRILTLRWQWLLPALELFIAGGMAFGCGLEWQMPVNHFDGVNEQGYVSCWEKVGEIDFGGDLKLPVIINFKSSRETVSPYLGKGFLLALLESNVVQVEENRFNMVQPDGLNIPFVRDKSASSTLQGGAGWMAEIKGETLTAWAKCGWKIEFRKGRISSITTPHNRKLEFVRAGIGDLVTEVRENGNAKFTVEQDGTGAVKALLLNGKRMGIDLRDKPRVEVIQGTNVVGGMDLSLHQLTLPDATRLIYEFGVDKKIQPTLEIIAGGNRTSTVTWDPESKRIVADKDWNYRITPASKPTENARITRTNQRGEKEYWFNDLSLGIETTEIGGTSRVVRKFTGGKLRGQLRRIEETSAGKTFTLNEYSYDEQGKVLRIKYHYPDGRTTSITREPNGVTRTEVDDSKAVVSVTRSKGLEIIEMYKVNNGVKESIR